MSESLRRRLDKLEAAPARPPCTDPAEMSENELWAALLPSLLSNIQNKDQRARFEEAIRGMCHLGEAHVTNEALEEIMAFDMQSLESGEPRMIPEDLVDRFLSTAPPWWEGLVRVVADVP